MHLAIRSARLMGPPERDSTAMRWIHRGDSDAITWVNANSARTAYIPIRVPVCRPELANLKERHVYAKQEEYYWKRAQQCRNSAERAQDRSARKIHLEFARRYEDAARQIQGLLQGRRSS